MSTGNLILLILDTICSSKANKGNTQETVLLKTFLNTNPDFVTTCHYTNKKNGEKKEQFKERRIPCLRIS